MNTLLAAAAVAAVCLGLLMVAVGLYGTDQPERPRAAPSRRVRAMLNPAAGHRSRRRRLELAAAAVVGLLLLLVSGLPVTALVGAGAVAGIPPLLRSVRATAGEIERLEALQTWVRRLSDLLSTNSELTRTLIESARTAPKPIAAPLADLAVRLDAGWSVDPALRMLADDLDSGTGDLIVAALLLGLQDRGSGLAEVLTRLADTIADDVSTRRTIEAEREKPRQTARIVLLIMVVVAGGLVLLNPAYLAPYATPVGQVVLAVIGVYMAACLLWLRSLAASPAEARFLTSVGGAR
ncbi:MAG: type II secretion system F family protein [Actinomycetota bacterium]|nr:type II secretion system F family protein [Actinomycetota bacterium]